MEQNLKVTSVSEYKKSIQAETKVVKLESGNVFKIQKLSKVRHFVVEGTLPVESTKDISQAENTAKNWNSMSGSEKRNSLKLTDKMICASVVEPQLTLDQQDNTICIDDVADLDYYGLINEINKFKTEAGGKDLKPFRNESEQTTVDDGQDSDKVFSSSDPSLELRAK